MIYTSWTQIYLLMPIGAGIYCNECSNLNKKCTNDPHPKPHASNMDDESKKHSSRNSHNIVSPKVYVYTKILPSTPSSSSYNLKKKRKKKKEKNK